MNCTFDTVPRSISIPAFWLGVPVSSLLSRMIASPMFTSFELTEVVVPLTVKLPLTIRSVNVGLASTTKSKLLLMSS